MRNSDSPIKRSAETFDAIVCAILAVGYIMRENDHGEITCKFQPCYFFCQIPVLTNFIPFTVKFHYLHMQRLLDNTAPAALCAL